MGDRAEKSGEMSRRRTAEKATDSYGLALGRLSLGKTHGNDVSL